MKDREQFSKIAAVSFCLILGIVFALNLMANDRSFSSKEKRVLQKAPALAMSHYLDGRMEKEFETYANDQFFARDGAVKVKVSADVTMGALKSLDVIKAKDSYLMQDIKKPDHARMKETIASLPEFRQRYPSIKMYFMLAPNAANILHDKLPKTVKVNDQNLYMDSFFKRSAGSGYINIDVRKALIRESKKKQIYYRTDHHWTTAGAFTAYGEFLKAAGKDNPIGYDPLTVKNDFAGSLSARSGFTGGKFDSVQIYEPKAGSDYKPSIIYFADSKKKTTGFYQLKNLKNGYSYDTFGGYNRPLYTVETPTISSDKLLLIKDSYANEMIPFLSQNYRKIVVVDPRYYYGDIDDLIASEDINQVLFIFNANTFFEEITLKSALSGK